MSLYRVHLSVQGEHRALSCIYNPEIFHHCIELKIQPECQQHNLQSETADTSTMDQLLLLFPHNCTFDRLPLFIFTVLRQY